MKFISKLSLYAIISAFTGLSGVAQSGATPIGVEIRQNQLQLDGQAQPLLFGAELQYFRMRGGYEKNIPRAKVIKIWNDALDRMVEAKMNAVSFYIPWDFHEYAEGKFDFTGTADEDGDGNPDYPSRDVITFFKLIEQHGIKIIQVRPGPYINAEWGFLSFGAIPSWFHAKFPEAHALNASGDRAKIYDYHNPTYLAYTKKWFERVYNDVLKDRIGEGKPIRFVQIDNETNYQWSSLYSQDYGAPAIERYRTFLKSRYASVAELNSSHGSSWKSFNDVDAPRSPDGLATAVAQDWYRFQDEGIYSYLAKLRKIWEDVGVHEPQVMFTLAESYNAFAHGLLPNYRYKNAPGVTGMIMTNLYPKTDDVGGRNPLHNQPFKSDLDVISADEATDLYIGRHEEWAMGPEIQGGWFKWAQVSNASRQQTYLTVGGQGLKAIFVYYFNEGDHYDVEWVHDQVKPLFDKLLTEQNLKAADVSKFPITFWRELQKRSDKTLLSGLDVRHAMRDNLLPDRKLVFDSPVGGDGQPRAPFASLREVGEKVFGPYADFLGRAVGVYDNVAIIKDMASHVPSSISKFDEIAANGDWAAGLLGWYSNEGVHPRVLISEISDRAQFDSIKMFAHIDTGDNDPTTIARLKDALASGRLIVNFFSTATAQSLGIKSSATPIDAKSVVFFSEGPSKTSVRHEIPLTGGPLFKYELPSGCNPVLKTLSGDIVGFRCGTFVQLGALVFNDYNSSNYASLSAVSERRALLQALLTRAGVDSTLKISASADKVAAFARTDGSRLWVTMKTPTARTQTFQLSVNASALVGSANEFTVKQLMSGATRIATRAELVKGIDVALPSEGSDVLVIDPK